MAHVFISYRRVDQSFAERLRDALRAWGHETWLDIDNIPQGAYWADEIDKGLAACDVVVGLISPEAVESRNVKNEWYWALDNGKPLIPLLLQPCALPHRINSANYIDATKDETRTLEDVRKAITDSARPQYRDDMLPQTTKSIVKSSAKPNRAKMLQNVHDFWIKGVLDNALHDSEFQLGMALKPDALLKHVDYGDYTLPTTAGILNVFDDMSGELLILGAPGAGKTILMLQLARELLKRAEHDEAKPIPVVLNLSSWAEKHSALAAWLIERLFLEYGVSRKLGKQWVENETLLPLLDGLDEVKEDVRSACVDAINDFRQQYRTVDTLVCSRIADYDLLTSKLNLQGAILLQPLTDTDVRKQLAAPEFEALRAVVELEPYTREMTKIPFLLNTISATYHGTTLSDIGHCDSETERRDHLFNHSVKRRFDQNSQEVYTLAQTRKWLSWLAGRMAQTKQSVFYIEGLQPHWLEDSRQRPLYRALVGLIFGLPLGLVVGIIGGLVYGVAAGLLGGFAGALVSGLSDLELAEIVRWSWSWRGVGVGVAIGLVYGVVVGFVYLVTFGLVGGLVGGLTYGVAFGLAGGLAGGLTRGEAVATRTAPNQGVRRSVNNALRVGLTLGLAFGLVGALAFGLIGLLEHGLLGGLAFVVAGALTFGLALGLMGGLTIGGGSSVIKHTILRLFLAYLDCTPFNYARFLDFCASIGILRKVGGGYIFQHRMLLEYFAGLETDIS